MIETEAEFALATHGESLSGAIRNAEVLLVTDFRSGAVETAWPHANRLKWIHATSAGIDALLFAELVESAVPLTNARGIFDRPIAEYVLGLVLAFAKDLPTTLAHQTQRRWRHRDNERIEGRTMLVVGAGSIGVEIGRLAGVAPICNGSRKE